MGGKTGQRLRRVGARLPERPIRLALEIEDAIAEQPRRLHDFAETGRHRSEILADDERARLLGSLRERGQHGVQRIADIATAGRVEALRNPVETREPHDVIEADRAGRPHGRTDVTRESRLVALPQCRWLDRRQAPVLAPAVEKIGRRPHAGRARIAVRPRPCRRAVGRDADRQIQIETDAHAGGQRASLRVDELAGGEPLQPFVEADAPRVRAPERGDLIGARRLQGGRPPLPSGAVTLPDEPFAERFEGGEILERFPLACAERIEPGPVTTACEGLLQRPALGLRDTSIVDVIAGARRRDVGGGKSILGAPNAVERDVEGIEMLARGREVRARPGGIGKKQGVHRIDAEKVGAECAEQLSEARRVLEISDAVVARRSHAEELDRHAPRPPVRKPIRHEARAFALRRDICGRRSVLLSQSLDKRKLHIMSDPLTLTALADVGKLDTHGFAAAVEIFSHGRLPRSRREPNEVE